MPLNKTELPPSLQVSFNLVCTTVVVLIYEVKLSYSHWAPQIKTLESLAESVKSTWPLKLLGENNVVNVAASSVSNETFKRYQSLEYFVNDALINEKFPFPDSD